jgi:hypothetical protein
MLSKRFDRRDTKSKLASLYTSFFRQDHSQLSSLSLAQCWLANFVYFFWQGRPNALWHPLHSMLRAETMSYSFWWDSKWYIVYKKRDKRGIPRMLSPVRYILSLLRIEGKLWNRDERGIILCFKMTVFVKCLGKLGFPWRPWIYATATE